MRASERVGAYLEVASRVRRVSICRVLYRVLDSLDAHPEPATVAFALLILGLLLVVHHRASVHSTRTTAQPARDAKNACAFTHADFLQQQHRQASGNMLFWMPCAHPSESSSPCSLIG